MIVSSRGVRGLIARWRSIIDSVIRLRRGRFPPVPQGRPHESARAVRVEQDDLGVVAVAVVLGPVDPVAVAELLGQAVDADVPVVARAVQQRVERDLGVDLAVAGLREDQPDRRPVPAEQDEVDPAGRRSRSRGQRAAARDQQRAVAIGVFGRLDRLRAVDRGRHDGLRPHAIELTRSDRPRRDRDDSRSNRHLKQPENHDILDQRGLDVAAATSYRPPRVVSRPDQTRPDGPPTHPGRWPRRPSDAATGRSRSRSMIASRATTWLIAATALLAPVADLAARPIAARRRRLQPRHPPDPLRVVLPVPRPRRQQAQGRPAARHPRRPVPLGRRHDDRRPRQARRERAARSGSPPTTPRLRMPPPKAGKPLDPRPDRPRSSDGSSRGPSGRGTGPIIPRAGPRFRPAPTSRGRDDDRPVPPRPARTPRGSSRPPRPIGRP